jgi:hypothetical protein
VRLLGGDWGLYDNVLVPCGCYVGAMWVLCGCRLIETLETMLCFYYHLGMDKFTIDFIKTKIDEAVKQNHGVRALNISIAGEFYTYMISYDTVDRTVSGVIMQHGHKRKPINLSDILTK